MDGSSQDWLRHITPEPHHMGHWPAWPHWQIPARQICDHEIVLLMEGHWIIEDANVRHPMDAPSFFIFRPGVTHAISLTDSNRVVHGWVHFDWSAAPIEPAFPWYGVSAAIQPNRLDPGLLRPAPDIVPSGPMFGRIQDPARVFDVHYRMCEFWNRGSTHEKMLCRSLLWEILLEVLDSGERTPRNELGGDRLAHKARVLLDRLAEMPRREQPALADAVRELGYSHGHVTRIFRQVYGVTLLGYLNARRIHRARMLLLDTELTVSEITNLCGFVSLQDFSRLFQRISGLRPTEFRRQAVAR